MGYNRKITIEYCESKQEAGGFVCTVGALDMPTNLGGGGELVAGLGLMLMFDFSLGFAVSATSLISDNYKVC